jgi:hypothetical protein
MANGNRPRDLLVDLSPDTNARHDLAARIFANPKKVLWDDYQIDVPDSLLVQPRRSPPPPKHCKAALDYLDDQEGAAVQSTDWTHYALLVVVIGAIPFVAPDAG